MFTQKQVEQLKLHSKEAVDWLENNHPDCPWLHYLGSLDFLCDAALVLFRIHNLEKLQDKMHKIITWINAYPLDIFPEPDLKKAHKILKQHGMTLDAISASNMRHVLNGIKNIIER